jgi:lycopene beta-cyclase
MTLFDMTLPAGNNKIYQQQQQQQQQLRRMLVAAILLVVLATDSLVSSFQINRNTQHHPPATTTISSSLSSSLLDSTKQRQHHVRSSTSIALSAVDNQNSRRLKSSFYTTTTTAFSSKRIGTALLSTQSSISENQYDEICDVLVLGSGPAARAVATLISSSKPAAATSTQSIHVIVADQNMDREWVPNYGVWKDEWQSIVDRYRTEFNVVLSGGNVGYSIDREWDITDCFFGGSFDIPTKERMRIDRPYYRVDKNALQQSLTQQQQEQQQSASSSSNNCYKKLYANHFSTAIAPNVYSPASSVIHDDDGTTIQLRTKDGTIMSVRTKYVIDCTGHESSLVMKEASSDNNMIRPPGFQIAYGALVDVDETNVVDKTMFGPYDKQAMTLFDYRTDHYDDTDENNQMKLQVAPTFMYVMPLQDNQMFIEETSLVARPAISFQECKDRCFKRMEYLGIQVTKIHEEEYCYIPMGGARPEYGQRIIALGGSASMVHPATGYHICRCLMGAADVAHVITQAFQVSPSSSSMISMNMNNNANIDQVVAEAYHSIWSPETIRQRNFAVFGGEFLMKQNVVGLRGFFDGFFRLPIELWSGFLAGWPGLPNNIYHESWYGRIWYGMNFLTKLPFPVAIDLVGSIVTYMITDGIALPQSVTPLLGQPDSYEYRRNNDRIGDVAAKQEARQMILEAKLSSEIPVDFETTIQTRTTSSTNGSANSVEQNLSTDTTTTTSLLIKEETASFQ